MESSKNQTKEWRKSQLWYFNGKKNECEKYQKKQIQEIIKNNLILTSKRFNISTYKLIDKKTPLKNDDGFEWTEDFDGYINNNKKEFYFNLKFVCDKGGSQTRSLREVYHFIKCQINYIINENNFIYFINILDGSESYDKKTKFQYLLSQYPTLDQNKIFIGDMKEFCKWWKKMI